MPPPTRPQGFDDNSPFEPAPDTLDKSHFADGTESPDPLRDGPVVIDRKVTAVTKDWDPPNPTTTPPIVIGGATLAEAAKNLDKRDEWGRGGGFIRAEPTPPGNSPTIKVVLHANLIKILPTWTGMPKASPAAQAEWNRMIAKLDAHEQRHMEIAIEEADKCHAALMGVSVDDIVSTINAANATMNQRQIDLDTDTDHGSKVGVPFGDVFLDTTIV